ncbi:hypothetical protein K0M31_006743 [Melipona bicolor]|uniref:Uncharacterized protein n=1 Tax=Melipona bicolor TaxID=60889 RepID=A0AA40KL30_9HYME|nr:hypothetical protein K0M31_006743 [Melipona bicolor]
MPRTEYADMVYVYGFCDENANAARCEYALMWNPELKEFLHRCEMNSFNHQLLQHFDHNPSTGVRRSDCELGIHSDMEDTCS